ncbi:MAG: FkbM family methyltransferase [Catalinimonas sp.]
MSVFRLFPLLTYSEFTELLYHVVLSRVDPNKCKESEVSDNLITARNVISKKLETGGKVRREAGKFVMSEGDKSVILRYRTTDFKVYAQIFELNEYQPVLNHIDAPEEVEYIVDAGANVGYTSIWFSSKFPNARIIAIEPESGNYSTLVENVRLNGLEDRIYPLQAGLWWQHEKLELDMDIRKPREWGFSLRKADEGASGKSTFQGMTLADIMIRYEFPHLDILKIDIEGAERYLLEDYDRAAALLADAKLTAVEIHDWAPFSVDKEKILGNIKQAGKEYVQMRETTLVF